MRFGEGLAGNLILGVKKDEHDYTKNEFYVREYGAYSHHIHERGHNGPLGSVLGIRLQPSVTRRAVGILVINDETDRSYNDSMVRLKEFAAQASNHMGYVLEYRENQRTKQVLRKLGRMKSIPLKLVEVVSGIGQSILNIKGDLSKVRDILVGLAFVVLILLLLSGKIPIQDALDAVRQILNLSNFPSTTATPLPSPSPTP